MGYVWGAALQMLDQFRSAAFCMKGLNLEAFNVWKAYTFAMEHLSHTYPEVRHTGRTCMCHQV